MTENRFSYAVRKEIAEAHLKSTKGVVTKESRFAQQLLDFIPDPNFWITYKLGFKLNSLLYFFKKEVKEEMKREYKKYLMVEEQEKLERERKQEEFVDEGYQGKLTSEKPSRGIKDFLS